MVPTLNTIVGKEVGAEMAQAQMQVQVQVCGRQETLQLAQATITDLAAMVEKVFEVRPPFLFANKAGRQLQDDEGLLACISLGGLVVVRLTEGVLYDLNRRVDHLRHMQWGYFTDQMVSFQRERLQQRADIKQLNASIGQGHEKDQSLMREWQKNIDACQDLVWKERAAREEAVRGVYDAIRELQAGTQSGFDARDAEDASRKRSITEVLQAVDKERHDRDQLAEEFRLQFQTEATNVEDVERRLRRDLTEMSTFNETSQGAWRAEVAELKQQMTELRQALASEQRERNGVAAAAREVGAEVQRLLTQEVVDRQTEVQSLLGSLQELEAATQASFAEARQLQADMQKRLTQVAETRQEDRIQRQQESAELTRQLDTFRRSIERETQEKERVLGSVSRMSQEFTKRFEEESSVRESEVQRLTQLLTEEAAQRHEAEKNFSRSLAGLEKGSDEDVNSRAREIRDLQRQIANCQSAIEAEQLAKSGIFSQYSALNEAFTIHRERASEDQKQRVNAHAELGADLEEHRRQVENQHRSFAAQLEAHSSAADELRATLSSVSSGVGNALQSREEFSKQHGRNIEVSCQAVRDECELLTTKAVEELERKFQQDMHEVSDGLATLKRNCKEALQREVKSRTEHDSTLQDAVENEGNARREAVRALDMAVNEVRRALSGLARADAITLSPESFSAADSPEPPRPRGSSGSRGGSPPLSAARSVQLAEGALAEGWKKGLSLSKPLASAAGAQEKVVSKAGVPAIATGVPAAPVRMIPAAAAAPSSLTSQSSIDTADGKVGNWQADKVNGQVRRTAMPPMPAGPLPA